MFLGIYPFLPVYPICWHIVFHNILSVCISVVLVVISPLSFVILFIWVLFLLFLINMASRLSILLIFSKNQLLISLICFPVYLFLVSIPLISSLIFIIYLLLLALAFICCSFSNSLGVSLGCLFEISCF